MEKQDKIDFTDNMYKKISLLLEDVYSSEKDFDAQFINKEEFSDIMFFYFDRYKDLSKSTEQFFDFHGESDLYYELYKELTLLEKELTTISKKVELIKND